MEIHPPIAVLAPQSEKPKIVRFIDDEAMCYNANMPDFNIVRIHTTEQVEAMLAQINAMHALFEQMYDAARDMEMFDAMLCGALSLPDKMKAERKGILMRQRRIKDRFPQPYEWAKNTGGAK